VTTDNIISVRDLKKHFTTGTKIKALNGVSTDIKRGEVVVVIGPSGSGKSTFLRCLNLLEIPTGGTITLEGVDITDPKVNINIHRQKMGMVFQHFNLFPNMTILRNMTVAPMELLKLSKAEAEERAMTLLGKVGVVLLSLIVFFACLTTAIGLVSAAADFFSELSKGRVKYGLLVALICIFAAVIANVGISMIISLASPVLNIIYPVLLTQTVLSFFDKTIKNHNVNRAVAIGTFVMAIFGVLADLGAKAFDFVYALPLAEFGFFWLVPAVVAGVIGAFVPMTQSKE
jgi:hypothetical protein